MRFFFDNCLPIQLAKAIHAFAEVDGHAAMHLREKFQPNTADVHWIAQLSREGNWIIISGDVRITRSRHEREAWRRSGLTGFFLKAGYINLTLYEQAWRIVRYWPFIVRQAGMVKSGAGFLVPVNFQNGKLEQVQS